MFIKARMLLENDIIDAGKFRVVVKMADVRGSTATVYPQRGPSFVLPADRKVRLVGC